MDFEPSDDQAALQGEIRRFLADRVTPEARRAAMDLPGAVDRDLWRELAGLGVFSLTLPEDAGGVGLGLADATLVFEELGRALVPGPLIGTFLAAGLGVKGAELGETVVGLVPAGRPVFVEHAAALDALIVVADDGVTVTGPPTGLRPVDRPLDPLTPVAVADDLPPGAPHGGPEVAGSLRGVAALLAAATQIGLADAAVALATAYAKDRRQFDRPIGSFQAVKHMLAEAQVGVEMARAAVQAAGVTTDDARSGDAGAAVANRAVDGARIVASRAADRATRACVQVHGGMGFTWELDAHLYLKRALVLDAGVGSPVEAGAALAAVL